MPWLARNPEVVCTELEDGAILLNMDTRLYYSLNETGVEIWHLVDSAGGAEDLARALSQRYDVDEDRATAAVTEFSRELERERLVSPGPDGAPTPEAISPSASPEGKRPFAQPEVVKHDEPLHEITSSPVDPQLPLAE